MMIRVNAAMAPKVAASLAYYTFANLRSEQPKVKDMQMISNICRVYRSFRDAEGQDFAEAEADSETAEALASLIGTYIFSEVAETVDDDMDWLSEISSVYDQLCTPEKKSKRKDTVRDRGRDYDEYEL